MSAVLPFCLGLQARAVLTAVLVLPQSLRTNEYFKNLLAYTWETHRGPGGHWQWKPQPQANTAQANITQTLPSIMMLTSDLALLEDPVYLKWVQKYAADSEALTQDFGNAWYKLTTRSMGPVSRCLGSKVPPAQVGNVPSSKSGCAPIS
jgi:catalase (peroxidase I)